MEKQKEGNLAERKGLRLERLTEELKALLRVKRKVVESDQPKVSPLVVEKVVKKVGPWEVQSVES